MYFYDNHYYKISLCIIGQWPFQSRLKDKVRFTEPVFFISSHLIVLELWSLIAGVTDLSIIMKNISPLSVNSFIIIILINCLFNNYKMKKLLEHIEETWKVTYEGSENEILRYYAEESKIYTLRYEIDLYKMWLFYCLIPIIISEIYTFLSRDKTYSARFLYRLEHVLDIDKYYNLLMLHVFITILYIISTSAVDSLLTLYAKHVYELFSCIKYNVQRIENSEIVLLNTDIADEVYGVIISCIKLYKRILKLVPATFRYILDNSKMKSV